MEESVDSDVSKASVRKDVRVRIPLPALKLAVGADLLAVAQMRMNFHIFESARLRAPWYAAVSSNCSACLDAEAKNASGAT